MIRVPISKILFLDIETVGGCYNYDQCLEFNTSLAKQFENYFDWFLKRFPEDNIESEPDLMNYVFQKRAGLVPEFAKIVCVSVAFVTDNGDVKSQTFANENEYTLLKEVQHDPEYYFHGEEISIAVRAYTHGYDLFHPHRVVIWHEYTRKGRTKQWDDDKEWYKKNESCHKKNRQILGIDGESYEGDLGKYGFGTERTIRDYEKYSGILFSKRAIQQYTIDKNYPPNSYDYETEEQWLDSFTTIFKHCIDISFDGVPENDYDFWVVAFHNEKDETLFRQDADSNEINRMMQDPDRYCKIWREFHTKEKPKYWVVWPYSKSKGWCPRLTGNL